MIRRLARDERGLALIEFAICLPVMILLFLGGYQLADAITCKRKLMITTRALADLTSQYYRVSDGQLSTFLSASTQIMQPYPAANAHLRITQVKTNALGYPTVSWSRGLRATPYIAGNYINLPLEMRLPNTAVILAETTYDYDPGVKKLFGGVSFTQQLYMLPRVSDSVEIAS